MHKRKKYRIGPWGLCQRIGKALYTELSQKGYNVTIVKNPLTSLEDDVAATNRSASTRKWRIASRRKGIVYYAKGFTTPITHAVWRDKPAYAVVATDDKSINPQIQRTMHKRSNTKITGVKGSHVVFMLQPKAVAEVVIQAAAENF